MATVEEVIQVDIETLTEEQIEECKQAFAMFDKNMDGSITTSELGAIMRVLGLEPTEAEVKVLVEDVEKSGSKHVELPEFLAIMARKLALAESPASCVTAFKLFDKENSGFVSVAEFRHIMTNIGDARLPDEEVDEMIKFADVDESGQIAYEAFVHKLLAPPT